MIVFTFRGLSETSGPSFGRRVIILETLARYRSCVVMLDLDCDDLVSELFRTFLAVARYVFLVGYKISDMDKLGKKPSIGFFCLCWVICSSGGLSLMGHFYLIKKNFFRVKGMG